MSPSIEVVMVPEEEAGRGSHSVFPEDGVEIPCERINPATLRNLITEFVTREWEEHGDAPATLDEKIEQVVKQLQDKKAKVVFDLRTGTCNIVPAAT